MIQRRIRFDIRSTNIRMMLHAMPRDLRASVAPNRHIGAYLVCAVLKSYCLDFWHVSCPTPSLL